MATAHPCTEPPEDILNHILDSWGFRFSHAVKSNGEDGSPARWVVTDVVETFSVGIVSSLLLDGYGSPMYRALVESGLGHS
jgi:hypothetical protein